jgi:Tfp pilus assembly protein PilN
MSAIPIEQSTWPYAAEPDAYRGFDASPPRARVVRVASHRHLIECAAAMIVGVSAAIGCAAFGPSGEHAGARRAILERELAELSSPLAELARLERAGEASRASAALAAAQARPYAEFRALLETLGREAHMDVAVTRLRQTPEGIEMRILGANSAACASWVARLAREPQWRKAQIVELKFVASPIQAHSGRRVEAAVRLPADVSSAPSPVAQRRIARGVDELDVRSRP